MEQSLVTEKAFIQDLVKTAMQYVDNSISDNSKIAYKLAFRMFNNWCCQHNIDLFKEPKKEELIALFLASKANSLKFSSLVVYLAGLVWMYGNYKIRIDTHNDTLSKVLMGIKRELGCRSTRKEPIVVETLRAMTHDMPTTTIGIRDKAIFCFAFAGAFRRSELVALDIEDLKESEEGYMVLVRKSKTDQFGEGLTKAISYGSNPDTCPVRAMKAWLALLGRTSGPIFMSVRKGGLISNIRLPLDSITYILRQNEAIKEKSLFSSHSFRSGFVTSAARNNVPIYSIMQHTGHKTVNNLIIYIREAQKFQDCASSRVGL